MIEFVTKSGARYRAVKHISGVALAVDESKGIECCLWSIQGGGFEMLYGSHWIEGKLRVKAGRRVISSDREEEVNG